MGRTYIILVLLLVGCSLGGGIKGRAADYYDFMLGNGGDAKYSSFLSPAYRDGFAKDALANLDHAMRRGNVSSGRLPEVPVGDILVVTEGDFASSAIDPKAGDHYAGISEARWIKAGARWYLYVGSEAEIDAYGRFPDSLKQAMQLAISEAAGDEVEPDPVPEVAPEPEPELEMELDSEQDTDDAEATDGEGEEQ